MERRTQRGGGIKTDVGGGTETLPKKGEEVACERDRRGEMETGLAEDERAIRDKEMSPALGLRLCHSEGC